MPSNIRGSDNFDSLASKAIGDGQTWLDLTGSRALNTVYTNTTGRPIEVYVSLRGTTASSGSAGLFYLNGVEIGAFGTYGSNAVSGTTVVVPDGYTYEVVPFKAALYRWSELR